MSLAQFFQNLLQLFISIQVPATWSHRSAAA